MTIQAHGVGRKRRPSKGKKGQAPALVNGRASNNHKPPKNDNNVLNGSPKVLQPNERFVRKRVASLHPSPENELLYKEPDYSDPEIRKLASAIMKNGCDALTVTEDNYVVSGHRRLMALEWNEQEFVRCRVLPFRRDSLSTDEYVKLLRSYNHQRHKSVAEQVKEELLDTDPVAAHKELCDLRDKSIYADATNGVQKLKIEGTKKRYGISSQKADHVKYVKKVVFEDRKPYWPLSVRAVHYALLNYQFYRNIPRELSYKNDDKSYDSTSELITRLRLEEEIPWEAFDDMTRPFKEFRAFTNLPEFVRQERTNLFSGYWRDLMQTQPNHIEVLCEKNTIYHMVTGVTRKYLISTSSGRGFNSIDPWHDLFERYEDSEKKRLIVIVLSDYDPEGEMIPQVGGRTLRDDFLVMSSDLTIIKAGVTREQIERYNLPKQNFAKESSSNHKWFVDRNGGDDSVYELEALDPADMLRDFETVIMSVIDIDLFNREVEIERQESAEVLAIRKKMIEAMKGISE